MKAKGLLTNQLREMGNLWKFLFSSQSDDHRQFQINAVTSGEISNVSYLVPTVYVFQGTLSDISH